MRTPIWFKNKMKYLVGIITEDNGDGTFDVKVNGRAHDYTRVSPAANDPPRFQPGDKVVMAFAFNNPYLPFILHLLQKGDGTYDDGETTEYFSPGDTWKRGYVRLDHRELSETVNEYMDLSTV